MKKKLWDFFVFWRIEKKVKVLQKQNYKMIRTFLNIKILKSQDYKKMSKLYKMKVTKMILKVVKGK